MQKPIYLVPCDFSDKFQSALRLGIDLAEYNKGSVMIIHIVSKKSDKIEAKQKMKKVLNELKDEERKFTEYRVLVGDIYDDIAKAAEVLNVALIVMGTHGAKGMQKLMGSHALKLVNSTSSPFMITQGNKYIDKMKNIVFPFSHEKESIQIAPFTANIAKQFNSKVHLIGFQDKDSLIASKMKSNLMLLKNYFTDQKVEFEVVDFDKTMDFEKQLMAYANKVDADLFAATFFSSLLIKGVSGFLQFLIENESSIPVLTVNSEELGVSNVSSVMIG
jgi:nucleotide-binding universal stress UspA family protein